MEQLPGLSLGQRVGQARPHPQVPWESCTLLGSRGRLEQVKNIWRIWYNRRRVQLQPGQWKPCFLSGFADLLAAKLLFEKPGSRGVALLYLGILSICVVFAAVCSLFTDSDFSLVISLLLISQKILLRETWRANFCLCSTWLHFGGLRRAAL